MDHEQLEGRDTPRTDGVSRTTVTNRVIGSIKQATMSARVRLRL